MSCAGRLQGRGARLSAIRSPLERSAVASERAWPLPLSVLLCLVLLIAGGLGCRPAPSSRSGSEASSAAVSEARRRQQLALRQCQQRRTELLQGLAELRRAEANLAALRATQPVAPPPAPVWDEAREQRFSEQDQELDRQRYEQELEAWQQRHGGRFAVVQAHRWRLNQAQQRLDRQAQKLQQGYPRLFTAAGSIEVRPEELKRLSHCPAGSA